MNDDLLVYNLQLVVTLLHKQHTSLELFQVSLIELILKAVRRYIRE